MTKVKGQERLQGHNVQNLVVDRTAGGGGRSQRVGGRRNEES